MLRVEATRPVSMEPLDFSMRLADFDLGLLPIDKGLLEADRGLLKDAVSTFFAEYFAKVGGRAEIVSNDESVAVRWFPESLASKDALVLHVAALLNQGVTREVEPILAALLRQFPADYLVNFNYGMLLGNLGRLDESLVLLMRAVELSPARAEAWIAMGVTLDRKGDRDASMRAFAKAAELEPDNPHAHANLGASLLADKHTEEAMPHLQKAVELNPGDQASLYHIAECLSRLGRHKEADEVLAKVIEIAPYTSVAAMAETSRARFAALAMRSRSAGDIRHDVVMYCADAIRMFAGKSDQDRKTIIYEISMLGKRGIDINDSRIRHSLKSLPGQFTGLELVAIMYVGLKQRDPKLDPGVDFAKEYAEALRMAQNEKNRRN